MTNAGPIEGLKKRLIDFINQNGLRNSRQRLALLEVVTTMEDHFTIDDLYQKTKAIYPNIGYATIYRTLNLFVDAGILNRRSFQHGNVVYELKFEEQHHDHLICLSCGKIIEFTNERMERLQDFIAKQYDFIPQYHRFEMYGYCNSCWRDKDYGKDSKRDQP